MTAAKLRLVEREEADLYARWKAEIAARDWSAVHVAGDRSQPLAWAWTHRRWWRK